MKRAFLLPAVAASILASCDAAPYPPAGPYPPGSANRPAGRPDSCPILGSSDWMASVNAMPGPGPRPTLIVTGKVTVPTLGYRLVFDPAPEVMESYPVQVVVHLDALPPPGPAAPAVTTLEARGEWPMQQPVGSVTVRCGDQTLARISPVETTH